MPVISCSQTGSGNGTGLNIIRLGKALLSNVEVISKAIIATVIPPIVAQLAISVHKVANVQDIFCP
jgi:hypothetical protein